MASASVVCTPADGRSEYALLPSEAALESPPADAPESALSAGKEDEGDAA